VIVETERSKCFFEMNLTAGDVFAHTVQGLACSRAESDIQFLFLLGGGGDTWL